MSSVKERVSEIIQEQPDNSTYEEILRELVFASMVERGLEDSRSLFEIGLVPTTLEIVLSVTGALTGGAFISRYGTFHGVCPGRLEPRLRRSGLGGSGAVRLRQLFCVDLPFGAARLYALLPWVKRWIRVEDRV